MIKKYTYSREYEEPHVVELTFELIDGRLVAPVGHRKRTRKYLHGHYHTSADDKRLYDSKNECIDAYVTTLRMTIAPTLRKIEALEAQRDPPAAFTAEQFQKIANRIDASKQGIDLSEYERRQADHQDEVYRSMIDPRD